MSFTKLSDWSATNLSNTEIDGVPLAEGVTVPSNINNAIRELMSQVAELYAGTSGDKWAIVSGGTGSASAGGARANLAVPGLAVDNTFSGTNTFTGSTRMAAMRAASGAFDTALPLTEGGTGAQSAASARVSLGVPGLSDNNTFSGANTFTGVTRAATFTVDNLTVMASAIPENGLYLPSANTLGFAANSANVGVWGSTGLVVGNTSAIAAASGTPVIQGHGVFGYGTFRWNAGAGGANIVLAHSRSGTVGTQSALQANDTIGTFNFQGSDGTSFVNNGATISAVIDGTVSTGVTPTYLSLNTQNSSGNPTERLRLNSAGTAIIAPAQTTPAGGLAGVGLSFGSTTNFGVFFGSGAPSLSAAKGSLYLRSDGSGIADRLYVNTNGSTTWTNFVSAA